MPTLPWTTPNPAPSEGPVLVMASRFELRSLVDVPRFLLGSLAAWRQLRSAPGALGASLVARPLRRVFLTLSAWEDREALYAYAGSGPHAEVMRRLRPTMRGSTFTFWEVPVAELPVAWAEAERRLAERARTGAGAEPTDPR